MLSTIINKIRLLFSTEKESYLCFYKMLGFYPKNLKYYKQALIHKSSTIIEDNGCVQNNERLEFLGDAVLDAVVADLLFYYFKDKKEGFLTNTRSKIVQRETLNRLAIEIGLDKHIVFSTKSYSHNNYMYGNAFEALIGAIYLDKGYGVCRKFIESRIIDQFLDLDRLAKTELNFKSKLIEWGQKYKYKISFELIEEIQDEQCNPIFQTEVLIEGLSGGTGVGYSKKESQQNASAKALDLLSGSTEFIEAIAHAKEELLKLVDSTFPISEEENEEVENQEEVSALSCSEVLPTHQADS
ncbi:ribonuclease III [Bacteroides propionicifaciens]|uniref:ribonuclease III n=1 Tax=Bacteroides propionicifaciens TaxID=392838 RepID=UPI0003A81471|nr:ribonuclease III [Bacteroides propionicifaciens]